MTPQPPRTTIILMTYDPRAFPNIRLQSTPSNEQHCPYTNGPSLINAPACGVWVVFTNLSAEFAGIGPLIPSSFDELPAQIRRTFADGLRECCRLRAEILFKDHVICGDDERHHARGTILRRIGHENYVAIRYFGVGAYAADIVSIKWDRGFLPDCRVAGMGCLGARQCLGMSRYGVTTRGSLLFSVIA